jgi:hypothetical protein
LAILKSELDTIANTIKKSSKNRRRPLPLTLPEKKTKERESAEAAALQTKQPAEKPRATDLQRQAGELRKAPVKTAEEKETELKQKRQESSPLLSEIETGTELKKTPGPEKAREEKIKKEKRQEKEEKSTELGVPQKKLESAFEKITQRSDEQALIREETEEQKGASEDDWDDEWED